MPKPKYGYKVYYKDMQVSGGGLFPNKKMAENWAKGFQKTFEDINFKDIKIVKRLKL